ncbi:MULTISPECIES: indolepyruvate oxidoreductase subunit beta family protein [Inquilinus]|uniref:Indolepyruvate ferredoxin oxidoreductase beta subunit n=1 Tax=Inquilinus ginsengisoli TaxID=363840 RepID=A0ABU1JJ13_9PROT|nr:indolepyruvate oxidoreductase subunit beta family protein [Inquilinus ginsengisoli]MDR6288605.1 indolepyruvate ferredoxin oxidoreductase beta subunit [Inquilinus ginsengisoli]
MSGAETKARLSTDKPLSVAILAMGGQGGGVLADWIVALAEQQGWVAQSSSVPGVAQRTGATIYYLELLPAKDGQAPVLSLMPTPGDVDIVIAAELMEAGRSVLRGLVTPDKTVLVASTHRSYAVVEKQAPGDGIGDPVTVIDATEFAARRTIAFDMQAVAEKAGSVVSAVLFGALAAAEALPFDRAAFEAAVRAGGKGVEPSLRAFAAGFARAVEAPHEPVAKAPAKRLPGLPGPTGHAELDRLVGRIRDELPPAAHAMAFAGIRQLVDFQDPAYAAAYLDELRRLRAADETAGGAARDFAFLQACAKYLAVALAYDDVIRVADLKTRGSRFDRVKAEVGFKPGQVVTTTEFMHPRFEEVAGTLPRRLGLWLERHPGVFRTFGPRLDRGRRVRTGTIGWFLALYLLGGLRRIRRSTLRHAREMAHLQAWLATAEAALARDYELAVEIVGCRRLVKGYSDTHARGASKFDRVLAALPMLQGRADAAAWLGRLKQAALLDEEGTALDGALKTIASFAGEAAPAGFAGDAGGRAA